MAEGNVLSVEPGFYEKDNFGIRIENLVHITKYVKSKVSCALVQSEPSSGPGQ